MKKFSLFPLLAAFALIVSCEKPQSEADKNAEIDRQVQQRLDAQKQADDQTKLAQQQADLSAREQALADREAAASATATATATPRQVARTEDDSDSSARVSSSNRETSSSYDTFYRKLEPYGAWRETDDYGFVWQPRQAQSRDWRPYTNGRWAYTDAGWTWVSEEPFGWATYHYGRWTRLRNVGWVWVPGEEWAPAWVSWRKGDQNVGWAPLPPEARFDRKTGIKKWADSYYDISADEYVFIPNEDIGSERLERDIIPVERNVSIVNQTSNVTDITYNNTTVVNEGPNFDELRGRSHRPIERMRLERQSNIEQNGEPRAVVRGGILSMVAPAFTGRATERPRNIGEPIHGSQVDRNWTHNANQPEAERARAKMKSEATPPPNAPPKRFEKPVAPSGGNMPTPAATASATATAAPIVAPTAIPRPTAAPRIAPTPRAIATPASTATPVAAPTAAAAPSAPFNRREDQLRRTEEAMEKKRQMDSQRKGNRPPNIPAASPAAENSPEANQATTPIVAPRVVAPRPISTANSPEQATIPPREGKTNPRRNIPPAAVAPTATAVPAETAAANANAPATAEPNSARHGNDRKDHKGKRPPEKPDASANPSGSPEP